MKQRTAGHNETTLSGDTRADWSEAFELVPSLQVAYVSRTDIVFQGMRRAARIASGSAATANEQSFPTIGLWLGDTDLIDHFAVRVKKRKARDPVSGDL
jgi:hypothetical protein